MTKGRAILAAVCCLLLSGCGFMENGLKVVNGSETSLAGVSVTVCDTVVLVPELAPGEETTFMLNYIRDDSFLVETPDTSASFGYVTHGMTGDRAVITLLGDSIRFQQFTE